MGVLKHFKTPVLESLFDKVAGLKVNTTQMFSCEYCEIFKNNYFIEHLRLLLLKFITINAKIDLEDHLFC